VAIAANSGLLVKCPLLSQEHSSLQMSIHDLIRGSLVMGGVEIKGGSYKTTSDDSSA
jgi:hypothetical protein